MREKFKLELEGKEEMRIFYTRKEKGYTSKTFQALKQVNTPEGPILDIASSWKSLIFKGDTIIARLGSSSFHTALTIVDDFFNTL
jgi:hypothetical protein